ncbi:pseudouridine synthase [Treponema sp. C6A8]|uniref:pseudouridine synthase n=1 Tax=Treponema sp. C6A8 TaxID=1410609 RepID=UPI000687A9AB|nr:pseudouridine synthase [Treponema sp. C6A8]
MKIEIIQQPSETFPFALIYKPKALASAPITEDDKDNAFFQAAEMFPQLLSVQGRKAIEHGLLHRLDTATDGLLLIAASQEFYDYMICEQEEGRFIKYYRARCQLQADNCRELGGFPEEGAAVSDWLPNPPAPKAIFHHVKISSYFRSYGKGGKEVRPVTEKSGPAALKKVGKLKLYTTEICSLEKEDKVLKVECRISQGFRHQVRCHLAWTGLPIINDPLYNAKSLGSAEPLQFTASAIEFINPKDGKLFRGEI